MEANQTQTNPPAKVTPYQLMDTLGKVLFAHIEALVDARVNQIFEAHATVKHLDEQWEQRIKGFVQEAIDEHEGDYDHPSDDDVSDKIATHIAHIDFTDNIRRSVEEIISDGDYTTEERVTEMIDEADISDQVKEVLRNV